MATYRSRRGKQVQRWFGGLRRFFAPRSPLGVGERSFRRLAIDRLEDRQLLTVSPANVYEILVNDTPVSLQPTQPNPPTYINLPTTTTVAAHAVAVDDDGDFVAAFTRYEEILDSLGYPMVDPVSGNPVLDGNIYARYFTNEVQRLTLPKVTAVPAASLPSLPATNMSLIYGGAEPGYANGKIIQKITIEAGYQPYTQIAFQPLISGSFTLSFGTATSPAISFDEIAFSLTGGFDSATVIQNALQLWASTDPACAQLANAQVRGIDAHNFLITYDAAPIVSGSPVPTQTVLRFDQTNTFAVTSGFLPSVLMTTLRKPVVIGPIQISMSDARVTAAAIEQAFARTSQNFMIGPVDFPPPDRITTTSTEAPNYVPDMLRTGLPSVSVSAHPTTDDPLGLLHFDITFTGDRGKENHPALGFYALNSQTVSILNRGESVQIIKESGREFRVNPDEPNNPLTNEPEKYNQKSPAVAIDGDGNFIITWESEVPTSQNPGSVSDIFAQRFSPVGDTPSLAASMGIADTAVSFTTTATLPLLGDPDLNHCPNDNFLIQIDQEIMRVFRSNTGSERYRVERGLYLTMPAPHAFGAVIQGVPSRAYLGAILPVNGTSFTLTSVETENFLPAGHATVYTSPFLIQVGSGINMEVMRVTQVDTTTNVWTVQRGQEGTSAVGHVGAELMQFYGFDSNYGAIDGLIPSGNVRRLAIPDDADVQTMANTSYGESYTNTLVVSRQTITFTADNSANPPDGFFYLRIGYKPDGSSNMSGMIHFASSNLATTAADIQAQIRAMGYPQATVAYAEPATGTYVFTVDFYQGSVVGTLAPPIEYIPDLFGSSLAASFAQADLDVDQLSFTFRVNQNTANQQYTPHAAMDPDGNFVVVWAGAGQDISFLNGIGGRRFDRHGRAITNEYLVNAEDTAIHRLPFVDMSNDGHVIVVWERTEDPNLLPLGTYLVSVWGKVYDPQNNAITFPGTAGPPSGTAVASDGTLGAQFPVGGGGDPTASFDARNDFAVAWDVFTDTDLGGNFTSEGIRGLMAETYGADGSTVSGVILRAPNFPTTGDTEFRANSESFLPNSATVWPGDQWFPQAVLDADGDLVITYHGFGPDSSENVDSSLDTTFVAIPGTDPLRTDAVWGPVITFYGGRLPTFLWTLAQRINSTTNPDLLLDTDGNGFVDFPISGVPSAAGYVHWVPIYEPGTEGGTYYSSDGSVDGVLEDILIGASTTLTPDQLARLRIILEETVGLLRGEANGALFSRWDAAPTVYSPTSPTNYPQINNLYSDCIANANRDGNNSRNFISIEEGVTAGTFTVVVTLILPDGTGIQQNLVITPVFDQQTHLLDIAQTLQAINSQLQGLGFFGTAWPEAPPGFDPEGPVDVRYVSPVEKTARLGTPWEVDDPLGFPIPILDDTFEVTFEGSVHDCRVSVTLAPNGNNLVGAPIAEVQVLRFTPAPGVTSGWFALTMGNGNSVDLWFDASNPAGMEAAIQNAIQQLALANPLLAGLAGGVTVVYDPALPPFSFVVTFDGVNAGVDQPAVSGTTPVYRPAQGNPDLTYQGNIGSTQQTQGEMPEARPPIFNTFTYANAGTTQANASIGMEPDGDFVMVWTEAAEYTNGRTTIDGSHYADNVYYRSFDESTDTAGPRVSDFLAPDGSSIDTPPTDGSINPYSDVKGPLQYLVITFDEDMTAYDVSTLQSALRTYEDLVRNNQPVPANVMSILDSVTNVGNYRLLRVALDLTQGTLQPGQTTPVSTFDASGQQYLKDGIAKVQFGMNKAAELANQIDPLTGKPYHLSTIPSNKFEAVITLDASRGEDPTKVTPLAPGTYAIQVVAPQFQSQLFPNGVSGLRDKAGNPLGHTGFTAGGANFLRGFQVVDGTNPTDSAVENPVVNPNSVGINGRTFPESKRTVAVDGDGDHVVVWTAYDSVAKYDRVYVGIYDENGGFGAGIATPLFPVTPGVAGNQRYATVSCDRDGDFVVTWTQYDLIPGTNTRETNIYARRFSSMGAPLASPAAPTGDAFRVNAYTTNNQKWSTVSMDNDGDFVIVWSSYGQEDQGQLGNGYGVYARQFDVHGASMAPEFQVNVTKAGDQRFPSVALDAQGTFVVVWTGNQGAGNRDNVFWRRFDINGHPLAWTQTASGPNDGEQMANSRTSNAAAANQAYPDVAMRLAGDIFVVTWQSFSDANNGWEVMTRLYSTQNSSLQREYKPTAQVLPPSGIPLWPPLNIPPLYPWTVQVPIVIPDSFQFTDIQVKIDITDPHTRDLSCWLQTPAYADPVTGNLITETVSLFNRVPKQTTVSDAADFRGTTFTDTAAMSIADAAAVPPFSGQYRPEQSLTSLTVNGRVPPQLPLNAQGTWILFVRNWGDNPPDWGQEVLNSVSLVFTTDPSLTNEIQANTTVDGNQMYPSVAMADDGTFSIAWSGNGTQQNQQDTSGVFYQRFSPDGSRVGSEKRANRNTDGDQWMPTIGADAAGDFVVGWTGVGAAAGTTAVYKLPSMTVAPVIDRTGPTVSDVTVPNGTPVGTQVYDGDIVSQPGGVTQVTLAFDEAMCDVTDVKDADWLHSVVNLNNWALLRNGTEIVGGVRKVVSYELNPLTRKYEITLRLDNNGLSTPVNGPYIPLQAGHYEIIARDHIWDSQANYNSTSDTFSGNNLNGDYNAANRNQPNTTGYDGYKFHFTVTGATVPGAEMPVNVTTAYDDQIAQTSRTGSGIEETNRAVAIDHDGDYVVVWTRYGANPADPNNAANGDICMRLFNRDGVPLTSVDYWVNRSAGGVNFEVGMQRNATVAMDGDGDFVVVWEGEDPALLAAPRAPGDVVFRNIYARMFDARGNAKGPAFLVNVNDTANDQWNPAVAVDPFGNFVIVWATGAQPYSYFSDVKGQRYNFRGERVGSEFRVNSQNIAGTNPSTGVGNSNEVNPSIAIDYNSRFVVSWDQNILQNSGTTTETNIVYRAFNAANVPLTTELQANVGDDTFTRDPTHIPTAASSNAGSLTRRRARNSQIAMDQNGNFIIAWEAFQDNDLDIRLSPPESYGIYYRRFVFDVRNAAGVIVAYGLPETANDAQANAVVTTIQNVGGIQQSNPGINGDKFDGVQVNPSIAMDADGDYSIVWDGNGAQPDSVRITDVNLVSDWDTQGVFLRDFHAMNPESATPGVVPPPTATLSEAVSPQTRVNRTATNTQKFGTVAMTPSGDKVVVWCGQGVGDRNGIFARRYNEPSDSAGPLATELIDARYLKRVGGGESVFFNPAQMIVVFDENLNQSTVGGAPGQFSVLNPNNWTITRADGVELAGVISKVFFGLNPTTNKWQATVQFTRPLANGSFVLWARTTIRDAAGNPLARTGLFQGGTAMLPLPATSPIGGIGFSFRVSDLTPAAPPWGSTDTLVNSNANLAPEDASRGVNIETGNQLQPAVARVHNAANAALDGQYVMVWTTRGLNPNQPAAGDILAQLYYADGRPRGDTFLVNSLSAGNQDDPDVAIDSSGNFVVVWHGNGGILGDSDGVFGQRFYADGTPISGEFRVNNFTANPQQSPSVSMKSNGGFVVAWSSYGQDGDRDGVYCRLFGANGAAVTGEIRANTRTAFYQNTPDVAMAANGRFAVVWKSDQQDGSSWGVFGQYFSPVGKKIGAEFRVNQYTADKQVQPAVAMDADGDFVVAWSSFGQDGGGYGVYARRYTKLATPASSEFRVNHVVANWQFAPAVAMNDAGLFTVAWSSFGQDTNPNLAGSVRDYGIMAHMFNANGTDFRVNGKVLGEFRVNAGTTGHQLTPAVSWDSTKYYVVAWVGPDVARPVQSDIYSRLLDPPERTATFTTGGSSVPGTLASGTGTTASITAKLAANRALMASTPAAITRPAVAAQHATTTKLPIITATKKTAKPTASKPGLSTGVKPAAVTTSVTPRAAGAVWSASGTAAKAAATITPRSVSASAFGAVVPVSVGGGARVIPTSAKATWLINVNQVIPAGAVPVKATAIAVDYLMIGR